jgi:hypothetical protein
MDLVNWGGVLGVKDEGWGDPGQRDAGNGDKDGVGELVGQLTQTRNIADSEVLNEVSQIALRMWVSWWGSSSRSPEMRSHQ